MSDFTSYEEIQIIGTPSAALPGTRAVFWERGRGWNTLPVLVWATVRARYIRQEGGVRIVDKWERRIVGLTASEGGLFVPEETSNFVGYAAPGETASELCDLSRIQELQRRGGV